jgi:hypothetical protein
MNVPHALQPRRRASSDIKLLRLELLPKGETPSEYIGVDWSPAQPTENLSPDKAALALGVEVWAPQSVVKKRYRMLQLRYPPEQFSQRHLDWRPASELLSSPRARLNWYWQSGLIPNPWSATPHAAELLWDGESAEPPITAAVAMERVLANSAKSSTTKNKKIK